MTTENVYVSIVATLYCLDFNLPLAFSVCVQNVYTGMEVPFCSSMQGPMMSKSFQPLKYVSVYNFEDLITASFLNMKSNIATFVKYSIYITICCQVQQ